MNKIIKWIIIAIILAIIIALGFAFYNLLYNRSYDSVEDQLEARLMLEKWQKIVPQNNDFESFSDIIRNEGNDLLVFVDSRVDSEYFRLKVYNANKAVLEVFAKQNSNGKVDYDYMYGRDLTEQEINLIKTAIEQSNVLNIDCARNNPEDFNYNFFINYNGVKKPFENNECYQEFQAVGEVLP